jgi:hypothetical protein
MASMVFVASSSVSAYFIAGAGSPVAEDGDAIGEQRLAGAIAGAVMPPIGAAGKTRRTRAVSASAIATDLSVALEWERIEGVRKGLQRLAASSCVGESGCREFNAARVVPAVHVDVVAGLLQHGAIRVAASAR